MQCYGCGEWVATPLALKRHKKYHCGFKCSEVGFLKCSFPGCHFMNKRRDLLLRHNRRCHQEAERPAAAEVSVERAVPAIGSAGEAAAATPEAGPSRAGHVGEGKPPGWVPDRKKWRPSRQASFGDLDFDAPRPVPGQKREHRDSGAEVDEDWDQESLISLE